MKQVKKNSTAELIFYKNRKTLLDRLIMWKTGGKYSHCEIKVGGNMFSSSGLDGGVRKKPFKNPNSWDIIEVEIDVDKFKKYFEKTKGSKYDYIGILGFILPLQDRTYSWFCSEWCSNFLKISGYEKLWLEEPSKIHPSKLYEILKK